MKTYISKSPEETIKIAKDLAREILLNQDIRIIALSGDLGSGKTIFVQGFAQGLKIKEKIISPTFVLIRQHQIPKTKKTLYHVDLYRLDIPDHIKELGIKELLQTKDALVLIEWAEKIKKLLPKKTLFISLETVSETVRKIKVENPS